MSKSTYDLEFWPLLLLIFLFPQSMHFVDTLQHTSQQQVQEMQGDLDFKRKQLDYSLSTHERLKNGVHGIWFSL